MTLSSTKTVGTLVAAVGLWGGSQEAATVPAVPAFLVEDLNLAGSSFPRSLLNFDGTLLFVADDDPAAGPSLWRADADAGGATFVADPAPPSQYGIQPYPDQLTPVRGRVVFRCCGESYSSDEVWATDGTSSGTLQLYKYFTRSRRRLSDFVTANGLVFYTFNSHANATSGGALFATDGTKEGTTELAWSEGYGLTNGVWMLSGAEQRVFFIRSVEGPGGGDVLWTSDGTPAGTIALGDSSGRPSASAGGDGRLFYVVGTTLWTSDGTPSGTQLVRDFAPSSPVQLRVALGRAFFPVDDGEHGVELWSSDGTAAGTGLVADVNPGAASSAPDALTFAAGLLFFSADDGAAGRELWATDGSAAGTRLVRDIAPGPASSLPSALASASGRLYFAAADGVTGSEPWQSDGTAAGTVQVGDIAPGPASSTPDGFAWSGARVFFSANDGATGQELWATGVLPPPGPDTNGDGVPDILAVDPAGRASVLTSVAGALRQRAWAADFDPTRYDVSYADVTGDGRADLVARDRQTEDIVVHRSTGTSFLSAPGPFANGAWSWGWSAAYDVYFADATGDGRADLIGRYAPNGEVWVFPSTGTAFSSAASALWSYGWSSGYGLYFADVTADGKADLVSRYFGPTEGMTGDIYVAPSTGAGFAFAGRWTYGFSSGYDIYFADADGDGRADLAARYFGPTSGLTGDVYLMRSTGASFSWAGQYHPWTYGWGSTYSLLVRDVTGDGRADLVGLHTGTGEVYVARGTGAAFAFDGAWATGLDTATILR